MSRKSDADLKLNTYYKEYSDKLLRFCATRLHYDDEVDDCVQEAFVVFYKKLLNGEKIENPLAFLYRTADNFIKQRWREKKKQEQTVSIDNIIELPSKNDGLFLPDENDYDAFAAVLLSSLSTEEQTLYKKRYIDEKPLNEISVELELTLGALTMRLKRLREKIKDLATDFFKEEALR